MLDAWKDVRYDPANKGQRVDVRMAAERLVRKLERCKKYRRRSDGRNNAL